MNKYSYLSHHCAFNNRLPDFTVSLRLNKHIKAEINIDSFNFQLYI